MIIERNVNITSDEVVRCSSSKREERTKFIKKNRKGLEKEEYEGGG